MVIFHLWLSKLFLTLGMMASPCVSVGVFGGSILRLSTPCHKAVISNRACSGTKTLDFARPTWQGDLYSPFYLSWRKPQSRSTGLVRGKTGGFSRDPALFHLPSDTQAPKQDK